MYQYFVNDIEYILSNRARKEYNKFEIALIKLMHHSYLADFLYTPYLVSSFHDTYFKSLDSGYSDEKILKEHLSDVNFIFNLSHTSDIKIIFIPFPFLNSEEVFNKSNINVNKLNKFFNEACSRGDVFIDVQKLLFKKDLGKMVVNKYDAHPSKELHLLVAKQIIDNLNNKKNKNSTYCKN